MSSLDEYTYIYIDRTSARTLLLLHGTGGDEHDLIPIGEQLDSSANLLSVRGTILENGMRRFFKRFDDGTLDRDDLELQSKKLTSFIAEARKKHTIDEMVGVGYSNGANILLYIICQHPTLLHGSILLRPICEALPDTVNHLDTLSVHIAAGSHDEYTPEGDAKRLASVLSSAGARTNLRITIAGHRLIHQDIQYAAEWLSVLKMRDD